MAVFTARKPWASGGHGGPFAQRLHITDEYAILGPEIFHEQTLRPQ